MIQLQSKSEAEFLSKEWRSDLFGGAYCQSFNRPQKYRCEHRHAQMGPFDSNGMDILADIQSVYKDVEMERIMKAG